MAEYKDAGEIIANIKKQFCNHCNNYNGAKCRACPVDDCLSVIEDTPTIKIDEPETCRNLNDAEFSRLASADSSQTRQICNLT